MKYSWFLSLPSTSELLVPSHIQFVASSCGYGIVYNLIGEVSDIILFTVGPFDVWFCRIQRFVFNIVLYQWAFLQLGIALVRYIYIFVLKNPAKLQKEFWCLSVNLATLLFSFIIELVYQIQPGRETISIYVCRGTDPGQYADQEMKQNNAFKALIAIWLSFYICSLVRIKMYKKQEPAPPSTMQAGNQHLPSIASQIMKTSLSNLIVIAFCLFTIVGGLVITVHINNLDYRQINENPNYHIYHLVNHGLPFIQLGLYLAIWFAKNKSLRVAVRNEIQNVYLNWRENLGMQSWNKSGIFMRTLLLCCKMIFGEERNSLKVETQLSCKMKKQTWNLKCDKHFNCSIRLDT